MLSYELVDTILLYTNDLDLITSLGTKYIAEKEIKKESCKRIIKNYKNQKNTFQSALIEMSNNNYANIHYTNLKSFTFYYSSFKNGINRVIPKDGDVIDEIIIIGKNIEKVSISGCNNSLYTKYCLKSNYVRITDIPLIIVASAYFDYTIDVIGDDITIYTRCRILPNEHRRALAHNYNVIEHPYLDNFIHINKGLLFLYRTTCGQQCVNFD